MRDSKYKELIGTLMLVPDDDGIHLMFSTTTSVPWQGLKVSECKSFFVEVLRAFCKDIFITDLLDIRYAKTIPLSSNSVQFFIAVRSRSLTQSFSKTFCL